MEPEYEMEWRPEGRTPLPRGWAQAAPGGGVATPGTPSASLFAYKMPLDLKTEGGLMFFQKEFRCAATTRYRKSEPETPF